MFNKIVAVYSRKETPAHQETMRLAHELLKNAGFIDAEELQKHHLLQADLAIAIGGDGTFIKLAGHLKDTPILGINSDPATSEGALMSITIEGLAPILAGKYKIVERPRASVTLNGKKIEEDALNDVYVGTASQFHASQYIIHYNGQQEEHRSSGVLISTGSGSKAWYKSAGGIPFHHCEHNLKFLVREPYVGRVYTPKLLHGEIPPGQKIIFHGKRREGGIVALDSLITHPFNLGDTVEIELSDKLLKVIVPN